MANKRLKLSMSKIELYLYPQNTDTLIDTSVSTNGNFTFQVAQIKKNDSSFISILLISH